MKKLYNLCIITSILFFTTTVHASSARDHVYTAGKETINAIKAPIKGIFILGPRNIKKTYRYEIFEREKEKKCKRLRYYLFSIWRMPGDELKGIIDGCTESVASTGTALKELTSIIFSD